MPFCKETWKVSICSFRFVNRRLHVLPTEIHRRVNSPKEEKGFRCYNPPKIINVQYKPSCFLSKIDVPTIHKFTLTPENTKYNESIHYIINNTNSFSQGSEPKITRYFISSKIKIFDDSHFFFSIFMFPFWNSRKRRRNALFKMKQQIKEYEKKFCPNAVFGEYGFPHL